MITRFHVLTALLCATASIALLAADGPPPAPPAPSGTYTSTGAEGFVAFASPTLGATCVVTEHIVITNFAVTLPPLPKGATKAPKPNQPTPAFIVGVPNAKLDATIADSGRRCGPEPPGNRTLSMQYVHNGSYSTADGKMSLNFVATGGAASATITFNGIFNTFSQSGTASLARIDDDDPSVTYKADIPVVFNSPKPGSSPPKKGHSAHQARKH